MNDDAVAMRAWLDTHGLADSELLHSLPNHGLDGADRLTGPERRLLSGLLEARRAVVPGYRPSSVDRPSAAQDRPEIAEPAGLFDPGPDGPRERAAVEPPARGDRPTGRPPATSRRAGPRERAEERER
jgi:hypothetical protein